ncbi:MAG: HIT family protein [Defluviitaleaceae bacterium]|nr:HIT family protein [Defluviitaleaceae bacterium]
MSECIFCKIIKDEIPSYTVYEDDYFKVILDKFPSNLGHMLIITKKHYSNIYELDLAVAERLYPLAAETAIKLKKVLNCEGINILQNNEAAANQTVHHFHMHVIPRYENDSVSIDWNSKDPTSKEFEDMLKLYSKLYLLA